MNATAGPVTRSAPGEMSALQEWRRAWPVVAAACVGYGTGGSILLMTSGLFVLPMRRELGWSTSAVTFAPIISLVWALAAPISGLCIDRLGSRRAAIIGCLSVAACLLLLALLPTNRTTLYSVAALAGIAASLTVVPTYTRGVGTWFRQSVGLAFGITMSGSALVAIAALPITSAVIQAWGWRAGFEAVAAIVLGIGLPAVLLGFRECPRPVAVIAAAQAAVSGKTLGEAVQDLRFWLYVLSFSLACVPVGGYVAHLQPLLATQGVPLREAVLLGIVSSIAVSIGRVVGGTLLDRVWPFAVAFALLAIAAVGAAIVSYVSGSSAFLQAAIAVALIAMGQGAEGDFVAFFGLRSFGMRAYSTIIGVFTMAGSLSIALGAFAFGATFDHYGSYAPASRIGAGCLFGAALAMLAAGLAERRMRRPLAATAAVE